MSVASRIWFPRRRSHQGAASPRVSHVDTGQLRSVAGLVARPVRNPAGQEIGRVRDVVVRWDEDVAYPLVTGLVVRVGRRSAFIHAGAVSDLSPDGVRLSSAKLALDDFARREGEITLVRDVLDHQLIDVAGVRVVRASDLYLAAVAGAYRLVGVDVGLQSLVRRLGPARARRRPTPSRVIDWSTVQPISRPGEALRLGRTRHAIQRLRPAELADLVEELGAAQRQALVAALDADVAADVLEEMTSEPLDDLLADMPRERAAELLTAMAPDEASEALREMDDEDRDEVLSELPQGVRGELSKLLAYDDDTAGAIMTTVMVLAPASASVADAIDRLAGHVEHRAEIDGVLVVDDEGRLVDDVSVFELLLADRAAPLAALVAAPFPAVVRDDAAVDEVLERFVDSRGSSLVVVDAAGHPVGRILADDVIDALLADRRLGRRGS